MHQGLVDMAREEKEINESPLIAVPENKYPYGLRITLTQEELEKLGVDHSDWEIGATFHLHAFAKVTSISEDEREGGEKTCCVGLQITHLQGENEDEEGEEEEHDEPYSKHEEEGPDLKSHGYLRYSK